MPAAERVRGNVLVAVRGRTWAGALQRLGAGYRAALREGEHDLGRQVA